MYNISNHIIVNLDSTLINITDADYGKFNKMLRYLSNTSKNRLEYSNSKPVKKKDISKHLGYKKLEYFNKYLRKLKKLGLLEEKLFGDLKYIVVNPLYAVCNDFILERFHVDLFGSELIAEFCEQIEDIDLLDDYKNTINNIKYQHFRFKISKDRYYTVIDYPINDFGIYVLYNNNEIIYIGKSKNIKNRVSQHKSDKVFNSVKSILFKDLGMINIYEPYLIQKYMPGKNKELLENTAFELPEIVLS